MIKEYIAYLKDNPNHYWFKRKLLGWGWTPATWQGWLVTLVYVALLVWCVLTLDPTSSPQEVLIGFVLPLIVLTAAFFVITYKKGESPKWQWWIPKDEENK